ncbi:MAG: oxygen-independent coproporphyrinogen III oxidase [Planctomycetota bacterium]|nr:MAG: oxygen-independent coproporphyrinogen III oxidase [Planctomycetota bacterium]
MVSDELPELSADVLGELAVSGPRYTSYPTAPEWSDAFGEDDARAAYARAAATPDEPLSVYVHLPFCERLCLYCGCTTEINGRHDRADSYLDAVEREIALVSEALGDRRQVAQLHWGGGTPTFLTCDRLRRLHAMLVRSFELLPDAEVSIEVDPHVTSAEQVDTLADLGFNRVSMGLQDLDPVVQQAVRREQTLEETVALVQHCRARGVSGLNVDLMYGLPEQTAEGFGATLDLVADEVRPDRLAVFGYAHVPWLKPAQKVLEKYAMPTAPERAGLFGLALRRLGGAGYTVVGLDHFARDDDPMVAALHAGSLHRNFMGYATRPAPDMVGLGMSAIGDIAGSYIQNTRDTAAYEATLAQGHLPVVRGLDLSAEDLLRRQVILSLMCRMHIDWPELEAQTGHSDLARHFASQWAQLAPLAERGFCTLSDERLDVTPLGRLFLRHLAMVFDEHLAKRRAAGEGPRFSKTI